MDRRDMDWLHAGMVPGTHHNLCKTPQIHPAGPASTELGWFMLFHVVKHTEP